MVKLSVIVPVYNTKKYLKECIDSIRNQYYSDIEIILIDDGSTDGSGEICDTYQKMDNRVRVIHQENGGCISARLCGVKNAKGKYITFVDSDDWISRDMYKILMSVLEEKKCDIVSIGYIMIHGEEKQEKDNDTLFGIYKRGKNLDVLLSNMMYDPKEKRSGLHPTLWSKVIRKELLLEAFNKVDLNITIGEDAAILYPCCLNADSICILKEYKYYYRIHDKSMCRTMSINTISEIYSFYQYMKKTLVSYDEKYGLYKQLKKYTWRLISLGLKQIFDIQIRNSYIFPYAIIDRNSDIILYGAGEVGQSYYDQILENHYCNVVAWVDKNKSNKKNSDIIHPDQIYNLEYSKIVIAIMKEKIAKEIIDELVALGIDKEKILWIEPQMVSQNII